MSHKCLLFKSTTTYLSWSIIQIIVLSIDTDAESLSIRISRCVLWRKMTCHCPKNQLAQMKSGTLLLSSWGEDGREGTTSAHPCLTEIVISLEAFRKIEFVILFSHLRLFSPHPYVFFNRPYNDTMTFLGFRVDEEGNLLDPRTEQIIQERLMTRHLRTGLHVQRVDFNTDFESYSK